MNDRIGRRGLMGAVASVGAGYVAAGASPVEAKSGQNSTAEIAAYGAVGDGVEDDTIAFLRAVHAVRPGGVLHLEPGRSYRLTRSLVLLKPMRILGSVREQTRLLFDDGAFSSLGGALGAIIFPHASSGASPSGNAQRSAVEGLSIAYVGRSLAAVHGMLIASPTYCDQVDVSGFSGDGFRVEASSDRIKGNANGCSFVNCAALANRGNGFSFCGNDANAGVLIGSRSFDNLGIGFSDESLLGNTYIACEVDNNKASGYYSDPDLPNCSIYVGCYAEPGQPYSLNQRNMVIGPLGHAEGGLKNLLRTLPTGELYTPEGVAIGADASSISAGTSSSYIKLRANGLELVGPDGQRVRLTKSASGSVELLSGADPVLRIPAAAMMGESAPCRPIFPNGFWVGTIGGAGIMGSGSAPPSSGAYRTGAIWLDEAPKPGGWVGWICVASGTPGNWRRFGAIEK